MAKGGKRIKGLKEIKKVKWSKLISVVKKDQLADSNRKI